jgi:Tfp pilus assembly protein PilF
VLLAIGDGHAAVTELERILEVDPAFMAARIDLAVHALSGGQWTEALEQLAIVLAVEPANERALFYRGVAVNEVGDSETARGIFIELAKSDSKYGEFARHCLA